MTRKALIFGGTGFLGVSVARHLDENGFRTTLISRTPPARKLSWEHVPWDGRTLGAWTSLLGDADVIINLAGRSVDCIKTPENCDEILRSRVDSTRAIGAACRSVPRPPPVWIQMSTAHIYGDPPEARCDESSPFGTGLAPTVGQAWEQAFSESILPSQRGVILRTSFVLGRPNVGGRGALGKLALLARLGLGGRVGSGTQGMSWIHKTDLLRFVQQAIHDPAISGPYIISSPDPVPQEEFMRTLRRQAGGLGKLGIGLPAPEWLVRIGAPLVLHTDPELALYGRYVIPKRLLDAGFVFKYPTLDAAVASLWDR